MMMMRTPLPRDYGCLPRYLLVVVVAIIVLGFIVGLIVGLL